MKRALIFANGEMDTLPPILKEIDSFDLIIAADGGTQHCKSLGITPHVVIGDLDSLDANDLTSYQQSGVEIIQFPTQKDETDLELAIKRILNLGIIEVYIVGALGARWDMTIANVLLLAHREFSGLRLHILDGSQELQILRGKRKLNLQGKPGSTISLLPIAGDVHGITTTGLEYPLRNETLYFGTSRGVSNILLSDSAEVFITEGVLLICHQDIELRQTKIS